MSLVSLLWVVWPGIGMAEAQGVWLKERVVSLVLVGESLLASRLGSAVRSLAVPAARKEARRDEETLLSEPLQHTGHVVWCLKFTACLCWT